MYIFHIIIGQGNIIFKEELNKSLPDKYGWNHFHLFDKFTNTQNIKHDYKIIDLTPLYLRPDAHVKGKKDDCLHFCMPGPLDLFSIILQQMLYNKEI